ncbi:hypothetical protein CCR85_04985 [Rhodothalassium salexigens]|uniref:SDR family NAD(P)-dependent oxidoreductase n=1 Tax=Rhodothalassium salexigens TaxID=1086 RepID=UPI001912F2F3|nr:SDR family NAD(P)-dependent oxidoreductase [Rhodothalassium salexigens]MBK5910847.1 hypothetical protein [Rhodothalassium salexigens]MBK5919779.1 hypothetical protein [Rhodothalassium salexigens]
MLTSFDNALTAVVIGATGGIGGALTRQLLDAERVARVVALSRHTPRPDQHADRPKLVPGVIDLDDEASIAAAARRVADLAGRVDLVLVSVGVLQDPVRGIRPEKSWRNLDPDAMAAVFRTNTIGPALAMKHFLPLLRRDAKACFAALSARVGSIEDNRIGGWHAYRASKAALNQILRNGAIELARKTDRALCVGLHPGTVDTALSKPFQRNVPDGKLFPPDQSAGRLLATLDALAPGDSGHVFAYDGSRIPF